MFYIRESDLRDKLGNMTTTAFMSCHKVYKDRLKDRMKAYRLPALADEVRFMVFVFVTRLQKIVSKDILDNVGILYCHNIDKTGISISINVVVKTERGGIWAVREDNLRRLAKLVIQYVDTVVSSLTEDLPNKNYYS